VYILWLNPSVHVRVGVRAILRQPALVLAEIAWRWAFGAAAWVLVILAIHRILAHLDVTQAELLIARHSDLFLIADACARILAEVLPQLAREFAVLAPAIAVLWIAAATLGRAVTLNSLLPQNRAASWGSLAALNCVRALLTLATILAFFGAMLFAGMLMAGQNLTAAAAIAIALAVVVAFLWSIVNWFLALAPIWIVRNGRPALRSVADSMNLYRRSPGPYAGIAAWFSFFRAIAFVAAFLAALIAAQSSPAAAIALCVVIALVYFAVADFLYIARLAAFVALEASTQPSAISIQPPAPEPLMPLSAPPTNLNG
jgi:hypothetical protein